jgi:hypothetical protein
MIDLKKQPHIHAEVIKAWADGAEIETSLLPIIAQISNLPSRMGNSSVRRYSNVNHR